MKRRIFCSLLLAGWFGYVFAGSSGPHPKSHWPLWEEHNPLSKAHISHATWQRFLDRRVIRNEEGITLVDYPHLTKADIMLLQSYLDELSAIPVRNYNRREQLAYWINLYNALTVHTIATRYPVESIEDINISPGLFSIGPWRAPLVRVEGLTLTLEDIEDRILRPIWNDSRILYALNNATLGAPNLSPRAYQATTLNRDLNKAAREYINSARGVQVADGQLVLSCLYDWYREDFGGNAEGVLHHLVQFANPSLKTWLRTAPNINSYIYNWHLNTTTAELS
ncbi:putative Ser/Thr protein kinase [Legionella geestiana]|uniref:Putative Ser/Thr protein kinase n=1 Tax=Legionella geestiana TaxID=45065 RepID=A0A0W0TV69_9GAMM|nr:DUF547 domain-containing protein [Legionella geestiana]KTC99307.1 putative Ser/Thr protein kinase [Legionella geestiana]STX53307.1 putative Ser/Thr protein kinase [Legionella geestiana]